MTKIRKLTQPKIFGDKNSENLVELLHRRQVHHARVVAKSVPDVRERGRDQMQNIDT